MESNEKNNKKAIITLVVGIGILLVLIFSATFAYFSVTSTNNFGNSTINAQAEAIGSVALNGTSSNLRLDLSAVDMMKGENDITYWGTSDGTPSTTQNVVTIGSTQVTGAGYFNCEYTLSVTATATNNMYTAFQGMTGKSTEQIVLKIGDTKYDFNTANLFPITINGTFEGVTSSDVQNITAEFYLVNKEDVNQNAIQGTDITMTISATNFSCSAGTPPPSAAESLIELAQTDNTIVKYTGKVTDTLDAVGTGVDATSVYAFTSSNSNNLVFANHCWQIRRTTENGGLKIQYNGEPTLGTNNGKTTYDCGTNRPYHVGGIKTKTSLSGTYLYGTGYTTSVSGSTTTFTLTGTESVQVTSSNASTVIPTLVGKYTCKNSTGTCTNASLYKVDSQSSSYNAYVFASTFEDSLGTSAFNADGTSVSDVGYMYNQRYKSSYMTILRMQTVSSSSTYLIGDGIKDNGDGTFTLTGTVSEVPGTLWNTDYANYVNKYVCMPGSYANNSGTYICSDSGGKNAGVLRYITETSSTSFQGTSIYKYGYGIEASGSSYTLTAKSGEPQTLQYITNWPSTETSNCFADSNTKISTCGYKTLSKSHYTCYNLSGICDTYYYIVNSFHNPGYPEGTVYYISINGGKYVSTDLTDTNNILYEMLNTSNLNTTNSNIKGIVDNWYENNLLNTSYENFVDANAIYCNDRGIKTYGAWNPDGGTTHTNNELKFTGYTSTSNLGCGRSLDAFSTNNSNAHLSYPIGLMSSPEMEILERTAISSEKDYWLSTPVLANSSAVVSMAVANGGINRQSVVVNAFSVRPAISLNSSAEIVSGTGSTSDPFIVKGSEMTP